ncbi:MAG: M23 family metallopeptidase [Candidatus Firestonebacteria bacterium]
MIHKKKNFLIKWLERNITIMLVPHDTAKVRQIRVPMLIVCVVALICTSTIGSALLILTKHVNYKVTLETNKTLQERTLYFAAEINKTRDAIKNIGFLEDKLKKMLQLKSTKSMIEEVGSGGPTEKDQKFLSKLLHEDDGLARDSMKKVVTELQQEIKLREQNFQEIQRFLEEQRSLLAATPSIWPVRGWITSGFGSRHLSRINSEDDSEWHCGMDIAADKGTPVKSVADGVIVFADYHGGYGKLVVINHGYGYTTRYGHNTKIKVKTGERVKRGDIIAYVGSTGNSTGPHLHYEVRKFGVPVNPISYIK